MKALLSDISHSVLNIVYPICCQGCGIKLPYDNKLYLCNGCRNSIKFNSPPSCIDCGRNCHFDIAWHCCKYEGLIKELIHNFKYRKNIFLTTLFVSIMHDFIKAHIDSKNIDLIACVPMDKMSLMKRGFNQASLLSEGLSKALDIPFAKDLLKKTKNTQEQVTLKKHQRFINVKGAFCITEINRVNGKIILLIDDVFTTGATVNECSGVLKKAGAKSVSVLALACGV